MVAELKDKSTIQKISYYCQSCNSKFKCYSELRSCPRCESSDKDTLVKIYMDHDPDVEHMYNKTDWLAG